MMTKDSMSEEDMWIHVQENRIMIQQLEDRIEDLELIIQMLNRRILVLETCEGVA